MSPAEPSGLQVLVQSPLAVRVASVGVSAIAAIPLGLAFRVDADPSGHGTHTQLGLAPCTILSTTGYPCPMCGATTSWALMAHLHPFQAFYNQPFGATLFLLAVAAVALGVAEALLPRQRWSRLAALVARHDRSIGGSVLLLMFVGWTWKLALMQGWV